MDTSIFLARFLGLYLVIITLVFLFRPQEIVNFAKNIISCPAMMPFSGVIALLFGLAIVIAQPIFEINWKGLITLIGLLAILKGILRLGFPKTSEKMIAHFMEKKTLWATFIISGLIGLILIWKGFA